LLENEGGFVLGNRQWAEDRRENPGERRKSIIKGNLFKRPAIVEKREVRRGTVKENEPDLRRLREKGEGFFV